MGCRARERVAAKMDAMVPDGHGAAPRQAVIPRESGIQYAANFRFYHGRLGILDHPLSRMMTMVGVACWHSSNATPHSRGAMRPSYGRRSPRKNRGRRESRVPVAPAGAPGGVDARRA